MKELWVGVLDATGILIDVRLVPDAAQWVDGINQVKLQSKPDLAMGRYRFERMENSFGYRFVPVSNVAATENGNLMAPVVPALVRAVLDLHGRGAIATDDLKALREFASSLDGHGV